MQMMRLPDIVYGRSTVDSFEKGFDHGRKRYDIQTLKDIGQRAMSGDYAGAQSKAFERGDLNSGFKMQQVQDQRTDRANSQADRSRELEKKLALDAAGLFQNFVDKEPDPALRAAMTQQLISAHPELSPRLQRYGVKVDDPAAVSQFFRAQAQGYQDPIETQQRQLEIDYKRAQIAKTNAEATDQRSDFGKTGAIVVGPDGKRYVVRYRSDGTEQINPLELGGQSLTPDRGVEIVGDTAVNKSTGDDVRNVGDALARGEEAKTIGKGKAEKRLNFGKIETGLKQQEITDRYVAEDIDLALQMSENPWATGFVGNLGNYIANTPGSNLSKVLSGVQANLGFEKLQDMRNNSPTGGALGSVTERELELLQATWGSIVNSQDVATLQRNLLRLKQIRSEFATLRRQAYEHDLKELGVEALPSVRGSSEDPQGSGWTDVGGVKIREKR
jgi:hypothetical protein